MSDVGWLDRDEDGVGDGEGQEEEEEGNQRVMHGVFAGCEPGRCLSRIQSEKRPKAKVLECRDLGEGLKVPICRISSMLRWGKGTVGSEVLPRVG